MTRSYEATDLWDHLKQLRREGHGEDVLPELLAYKNAVAEDMSFGSVIGDGDRHPGNILLMPDGEVFPADFGMADINRTHSAYRHDGPNNASDFWHVEGFDAMPDPSDPRFRDFVEAQMQTHLDWMVVQYRRHFEGFGEGITESFLSSFRYEDFAGQIAQMRSSLRDDVGSIVGQTMKDFEEMAPSVYREHGLDPELTTRLLETRLDIMDEFYQTINQRLMEALKKAKARGFPPLDVSRNSVRPQPLWKLRIELSPTCPERIAA